MMKILTGNFSSHSLPHGAVVVLLLVALLGACSTTGTKDYPYFERLTINALPPALFEEDSAVASAGEMMAIGAAAGGTGAVAGSLFVSLLCGPYFAVCFAGAGAAALGGAAVGAAMAGSTALSTEDTEKVIDYLEDLQRTNNLGEELAAAVSARLPADRLSRPGSADANLGLEVQGLRVATGIEDNVALWVAVNASLQWDLDWDEPNQTSRSFACQTESMPLADRLNKSEIDTKQELSRCIDDLSLQIWTALQEPSVDHGSGFDSPIGFGIEDPTAGEW